MTEEIIYREMMSSEIRDVDDKERSFSHPISDETVDGHGSIIKVDGWDLKRFKSNPVVLFAHDSLGLPIARSTKIWKEDGRLMTRTQFAGVDQLHPFAETAYKLARDGFIRAWSVGFRAKERTRREDIDEDEHPIDPYVYTKQELMEYSLVPIPSNPNAILDAKRSGHDVSSLLDWFSQHEKIRTFYQSRGVEFEDAEFLEQRKFSREEMFEETSTRQFEVQSLIFPKKHWSSAAECKTWAKDHDFKAGSVDETEDSYRLRQRDPEDFTRLRTICVNPGDMDAGSEKCKVKAVGGPVKEKSIDDELERELLSLIIEENVR